MSEPQWIKDAANEIDPFPSCAGMQEVDVAEVIARHYAPESKRVKELREAATKLGSLHLCGPRWDRLRKALEAFK